MTENHYKCTLWKLPKIRIKLISNINPLELT